MTSKPNKKSPFNEGAKLSPWREYLNDIIFGAETPLGKGFDIVLIIMIILSIIMVMLDSVEVMQIRYVEFFYIGEWFFTLLFTVEYLLRLICVRKPWRYTCSFFGIVDLLSILPTYIPITFQDADLTPLITSFQMTLSCILKSFGYIGLLVPSVKYMLALRVLRLLRVFRVLKLSEYMQEAHVLMDALDNSFRKIAVFLYVVLTLVVVFGSLMYVVEGSNAGFTSIPKSVYWAIVTLTTVGYGDIAPQSPLGQIIASAIMIMGYGIIAVPTGVYSAELFKQYQADKITNDACPDCGATGHDFDANYCKYCGYSLED